MSLKRIVTLPQGVLSYELQLQRRKTIGIYIRFGGVVVRAPHGVSVAHVESFLHEKSSWVQQKLQEQAQQQLQQSRINWNDGGKLFYLGRVLTLRLNEQSLGVCLNTDDVLEVGGSRASGRKKPVAVAEVVQCWMQHQALVLFQQRCAHFGAILGVYPAKIVLTSATTRWGSASARKVIRLHWRLLQMPHDVIDYVVVHELAHLKEMNHSCRFWTLVESVLPDYAQRRKQLKRTHLPIW